jgi:hypothetical protein
MHEESSHRKREGKKNRNGRERKNETKSIPKKHKENYENEQKKTRDTGA